MMTPEQAEIMILVKENGGTITKKEVVDKLGKYYYCNSDKHIGDRLSRMVNAGLLERVKAGIFTLGKSKRVKEVPVVPNQISLF